MKLFALLVLSLSSLPAFSQVCYVDMVDKYSRVVATYTGYGDPDSCQEGMKACRKAIRFEPQLGGADCIRQGSFEPAPQQPIPLPQQPLPLPQQPQQPQQPYPQPYPLPQQPQQPLPQRLPEEVLRMTELDQAINFTLQDCHVIPRVSGVYNQLVIRNQFVANFQIGYQDMELRRTIRDYQARGQCLLKSAAQLQIQYRPQLIEEAIARTLTRNCYVLPNVSGIYNQLLANGQFIGNFDKSLPYEQIKLKATLASMIHSGSCQELSYQERSLMQDPRLIQDFANFQYRGCHVKLNVSGIYHQVWVGNQFKANFDKQSQLPALKATLVDLITKGTCRFDPM